MPLSPDDLSLQIVDDFAGGKGVSFSISRFGVYAVALLRHRKEGASDGPRICDKLSGNG